MMTVADTLRRIARDLVPELNQEHRRLSEVR